MNINMNERVTAKNFEVKKKKTTNPKTLHVIHWSQNSFKLMPVKDLIQSVVHNAMRCWQTKH